MCAFVFLCGRVCGRVLVLGDDWLAVLRVWLVVCMCLVDCVLNSLFSALTS